jgi:uncharacterized protein (TIGR02647 family)
MIEFNEDLQSELNLLMKFPDTSLEGLKIHHSAAPELIAAATRLFEKGLTTRSDGGYLTDLGREANETAHLLIGLLSPQ